MFSNNVIPQQFLTIQHPFPPQFIVNGSNPDDQQTVPTNSWMSNLFYPSANNLASTNTDPYTIRILDKLVDGHPGLSVTQKQEKTIGGYPSMNNVPGSSAAYMLNQVVVDMRFSCQEWATNRSSPTVQVTSWDHFGATVQLISGNNKAQSIEFPLARGMAYVTAHYHALTPHFITQYNILHVDCDEQHEQQINGTSTIIYTGTKFKLTLEDPNSSIFIIYALDDPLHLVFSGTSGLTTSGPYNGTIRLAKLSNTSDESILDQYYTTWTTGGTVVPNEGSYTIQWKTQGQGEPLIFAYPHHIQTLTNVEQTSLRLESATKGTMHAVIGNTWTLQEQQSSNNDMPSFNQSASIDWFPKQPKPEPSTINDILSYLAQELGNADYDKETNKNDNYFSGKALQKYALLALLLNQPEVTGLRNPELARISLDKLKFAFAVFLENRQNDPFYYDQVYKGIVSRNGLPTSMGGTGNIDAGFGHSYYSDHHYHQGYFVVTAAIIHYLDPTWRSDEIKTWTEVLIRDVNSPGEDTHFAPYRNWDWFAGHTWAGGIKINGAMDGRDQESVPEAVNFYWGMKLWGLASKNTPLVQLANLQLDIMKRTTYEYFWMLDSNTNRHIGLVSNKVTGILFEQKLDYVREIVLFKKKVNAIN
ncbi:endo-1,3(4)-beta-glucanase [Halteromyces radiatus]|uniref:endo-1,3(4)-beta-glucanase n=1 Tax=Halteromyces radiatus TaxID=101107 RepID=UPI0022208E6C|nr:endo-1,3(4)-beta-glucanase [Halteromyces radiatus]KAI8092572.1 endo-1,3(4)-beta-glucanase [Halteromyces radiatus]